MAVYSRHIAHTTKKDGYFKTIAREQSAQKYLILFNFTLDSP